MKKTRLWKWIAAGSTGLAFLFASFFTVGTGGGIDSLKGNDAPSDTITASAATSNYEDFAEDNFSRFKDNAKYSYTEPTQARSYHNAFMLGNTPTDVDVKDVTAAISAARGTESNPFVITNVKEWNAFAKMATSYTATQNKYFALGCDIDADVTVAGEQILPIPAFGGTFCGNGFMISNITMNTPTAANNGRGLFNSTSGATISDLRIDMNMTASNAASNNGGFVGYVEGATNILNCQADVVWNQTGGTTGAYGGIVGRIAAVQALLYRCSANFNYTMKAGSDNTTWYGGLVGCTTGAVQLSIFDCTAKTVSDLGTSSVNKFSGGVVGNFSASQNANINIENVVADIDAKSGKIAWDAAVAHVEAATYYPKSLVLKNVYVSGTDTVNGTTTSRQLLNAGNYNGHLTNVRNATTLTNVHITRFYPRKVGQDFADVADYDTTSLKYYAEAVTGTDQADAESKLWKAAQGDSKLPADIWTDKSKIGLEFGTKSPIVNDMLVRVTYYNYKVTSSGADVSTQFSVTDDSVLTVSRGDALYIPTDTPENRRFLGWTSDPKDGSEPFSEMISGLRGEAKLYAVWEAVNVGASITASGTGLTDDPETGKTLVYNGNGGSNGITLTAELATIAGMSDPAVSSYQWAEGGTDLTEAATSKNYKVENVKQSGEYTVKLKFHSASEPLFLGEVSAPSIKATVTPAELTLDEFRFVDVHPYSGAPYSTAVPTATVKFGTRTFITGTTEWLDKPGNFNRIEENVKDGKETKKISFIPDESYNGNFGEKVIFEIEFEIEYLKFTFEIPSYGTKDKLEVNLEYGQTYTYNNIADLFEEAFMPYMSDKTLEGLTPVFVLKDDRRLKINEYRKEGTTAYANVKENFSLTVDFEAQSYKVTYNPMNGDKTFEETIGHGIRLSRPTDPENGNLLFLGWYYKTEEENEGGQMVPVEKAWSFDSDRITNDTDLYATWLEADTLDNLEVEVTPGTVFHANEAIDPSKLTVTATFTGKAEGKTLTQKAVLTHEQYTLEYVGYNDQKLHVNEDGSDTIVKVKYVFSRPGKPDQAKEAKLEIKPKKIPLDTSKLKEYFKDTTVELDKSGKAQSLSITAGRVSDQFSPILKDADVTYVYSVRGKPIPQNEVVGEGEYLVTANFKPTDPDYEAPSITATLRIVKERLTLNVTWDAEEFTYNGKIQVPTPTFTAMLDGNETKIDNVNYRLEGDNDAVKAGDNYSVTLVLDEAETGYKLGGVGAIIKTFSIKKAKVKLPTQKEAFEYCGKEIDLNSLTPDDYARYFDGFDPNIMVVVDGAKAIVANSYTAFITLSDPTCAEWDGATTQRVSLNWEIKKAQLSVFWGNERKFALDSDVPKVQNFIGLKGDDAAAVNYTTDITYRGDSDMSVLGSHTITMGFKSSAVWAKNYELDDSKSFSFAVLPEDADVVLVYVEWGDTTRFVFQEGKLQGPTFTLRSETNDDLTEDLIDYVKFEGPERSLWAGSYDLKLSLDSDEYFLCGRTSCKYTIVKNAAGEGEDPNAGKPSDPDDEGNTGDGNREDTSSLPIWQLIVTGVSAVLLVVCATKAFNNYGKAKAAKKETQRLAAITYSFVGTPLLAIEFLGMGETPWTIIACVTLGLFLIAFAAMLIMGKKRKDAELALAREEARIADEKEYAREEEQLRREEEQRRREDEMREEQRRRDEEFKMMFAAMQQGNQSQYGDMQNLLATVTALLPGIQQMQALPPAQGDMNAYNAPQQNYGAPQNDYTAPNYGAPQQNSDTDALRAQVAAQEERMARQEELINRLLQNQAQQSAAPAYAENYAEDSSADDAKWINESDEIVSLEELYGGLSDDAKRCYYEIGSYIMSKPRTSQNDGKYAVLFKYRGKTLFKLCIKENAPVLYYIADNGNMNEVRIADASSLDYAKSVVDMQVRKTDGQMY